MPDTTESTIYLQSIHVYIYNVDIFTTLAYSSFWDILDAYADLLE